MAKKKAEPNTKKETPKPVGRPKAIESPEQFYDLFCAYKTWAKANPRIENVYSVRDGKVIPVNREQPLTWEGFDTWLCDNDVITDSEDYRLNTDERYSEFKGVITRVKKAMYADKFGGAAVGIYNANIIARDLGLADKKEHGGEIGVKQITGMEIK